MRAGKTQGTRLGDVCLHITVGMRGCARVVLCPKSLDYILRKHARALPQLKLSTVLAPLLCSSVGFLM